MRLLAFAFIGRIFRRKSENTYVASNNADADRPIAPPKSFAEMHARTLAKVKERRENDPDTDPYKPPPAAA